MTATLQHVAIGGILATLIGLAVTILFIPKIHVDWAVALFIFIVGLAIVVAFAMTPVKGPGGPMNIPGPEDSITLAEFNDVAIGISYAAAVQVIGCDGVEVSRYSLPENGIQTVVVYQWNITKDRGATFSFCDDKLQGKGQVGLR